MSKDSSVHNFRGATHRILKRGRKLRRNQHGFTLLELLVVVAILGVLAGIITPTVAHFANKGKVEATNTELQTVKTGIGAAIVDNKLAPTEVVTPGTATNNFDVPISTGINLYPRYVTDGSSSLAYYCWNGDGLVAQLTSASSCSGVLPTPVP